MTTTNNAIDVSPPRLNQVQQQDVLRIWATQNRRLIDVRPSKELSEMTSIEPHTVAFIPRIYGFFRALLKHNMTSDHRESGGASPVYVKKSTESCFERFLSLVLIDPEETHQSSFKSTNQNSSTTANQKQIKLLEGRIIVTVHYEELMAEFQHYELKGEAPSDQYTLKQSFGALLYHHPNSALAAMATGMGLAVVTLARQSYGPHSVERCLDGCQWILRLFHVAPQVAMMDIRTGSAYKFLSVKGHIVKARPKRLRIATADFGCPKCGAIIVHSFASGQYSVPTKCITANCRSKQFILNRPSVRYINIQELRLQESQEESTTQAGRTPRQIEVELTHELVDTCRPGDIVLVAGIVQAVNSAVAAGRAGKRAQETSTYKLYLEAHSITTMSERDDQQQQQQGTVVYAQQQLQRITQLCHADHRYFGMAERMAFPFDLLVRSLCPSIIGHDLVKAGIILCLLGGTPPSSMTGGTSIRSNSHLLICGDPGMGKSQMLLAVTQIAARSVYVGGNTASTTGLTVSMTKEAGGEAGIEAGALVLADQGYVTMQRRSFGLSVVVRLNSLICHTIPSAFEASAALMNLTKWPNHIKMDFWKPWSSNKSPSPKQGWWRPFQPGAVLLLPPTLSTAATTLGRRLPKISIWQLQSYPDLIWSSSYEIEPTRNRTGWWRVIL
jgi:hypothetical protein